MGWVSLLEDAVERFSSDLNIMKSYEGSSGRKSSPIPANNDLLRSIERTLSFIKRRLELATDSSLNLADELIKQQYTNRELEKKLKAHSEEYKSNLADLRRKGRIREINLEGENKKLQKKVEQLNKNLELSKRKLNEYVNSKDIESKKLRGRIESLQSELNTTRDALKRDKKPN